MYRVESYRKRSSDLSSGQTSIHGLSKAQSLYIYIYIYIYTINFLQKEAKTLRQFEAEMLPFQMEQDFLPLDS